MILSIGPIKDTQEKALFYSATDGSPEYHKEAEKACVGHIRGDFGEGEHLYRNWFPHNHELNSQRFKNDIKDVADALTEMGLFKSRDEMEKYCSRFPDSVIAEGYNGKPKYGFKVETENYTYYARCFPQTGDYDLYLLCD